MDPKALQTATISNGGLKVFSMLLVNDELWVGCGDGVINIWNLKNNKLITQFEAHKARIYSMIHIGEEVWVASDDGSISIVDATRYKPTGTVAPSNTENSIKSLLAIDENTVWSLSSTLSDSTITSWNAKERTAGKSVPIEEPCTCMCMIKHHNLVWIGGLTRIYVVFIKTLNKVGYFSAHSSKISAIALTPEELIWCASDKSITIWSPKSVEVMKTLTDHESKVISLYCNGDFVFSGSAKTFIIWGAKSLIPLMKIPVAHDDVISAIISPERNTVVTGSFDRMIHVWSVATVEAPDVAPQFDTPKDEHKAKPTGLERMPSLSSLPLPASSTAPTTSTTSTTAAASSPRTSANLTDDQLVNVVQNKLASAKLSSSGKNTAGGQRRSSFFSQPPPGIPPANQ